MISTDLLKHVRKYKLTTRSNFEMKGTRYLLFFMVIYIALLPLTAYAHSGRTDGRGGHTNHSTGEYHYHHGYSAHQHYDINGDGIVDCPYDFDDKTSSNGLHNGDKQTRTSNIKQSADNNTIELKQADTEEKKVVPTWTKYLLAICALTILVLFLKLRERNKEIENQRQRLEEERRSNSELIRTMVIDYKKATGISMLRTLARIPEGDYIGANSLPASKDVPVFKWGYKYTFYGSHTTSKFHRDGCRYCNPAKPLNAYTIHRGRYTPCQVCHPQLPDESWVERYIKYKRLFEKHNVKID